MLVTPVQRGPAWGYVVAGALGTPGQVWTAAADERLGLPASHLGPPCSRIPELRAQGWALPWSHIYKDFWEKTQHVYWQVPTIRGRLAGMGRGWKMTRL